MTNPPETLDLLQKADWPQRIAWLENHPSEEIRGVWWMGKSIPVKQKFQFMPPWDGLISPDNTPRLFQAWRNNFHLCDTSSTFGWVQWLLRWETTEAKTLQHFLDYVVQHHQLKTPELASLYNLVVTHSKNSAFHHHYWSLPQHQRIPFWQFVQDGIKSIWMFEETQHGKEQQKQQLYYQRWMEVAIQGLIQREQWGEKDREWWLTTGATSLLGRTWAYPLHNLDLAERLTPQAHLTLWAWSVNQLANSSTETAQQLWRKWSQACIAKAVHDHTTKASCDINNAFHTVLLEHQQYGRPKDIFQYHGRLGALTQHILTSQHEEAIPTERLDGTQNLKHFFSLWKNNSSPAFWKRQFTEWAKTPPTLCHPIAQALINRQVGWAMGWKTQNHLSQPLYQKPRWEQLWEQVLTKQQQQEWEHFVVQETHRVITQKKQTWNNKEKLAWERWQLSQHIQMDSNPPALNKPRL